MTLPANPTGRPSTDEKQTALQDSLLKTFGNNADSLTFNHQGSLAPGQRAALLAQTDGWHYRLYYLPQSSRVVALEPL